MVTAGERRISKIAAVWGVNTVTVLPPCGRCREFMYQLDQKNLSAEVIIGDAKR